VFDGTAGDDDHARPDPEAHARALARPSNAEQVHHPRRSWFISIRSARTSE
jgi:hypothetical protein